MDDQDHQHHGREQDRGRDENPGHSGDCGQDNSMGPEKEIPIIVNGREKTVAERELSVDDLVKLAFENPPTGQFICFTITYRRGQGDKPQGTLEEGQTVRIKKDMVFNVTATDKS